MQIAVVSLFPALVEAALRVGVVGRAANSDRLACRHYDPRDYAADSRSTVDDRPFGGGPGMVMMAAPLLDAVAAARAALPNGSPVVYLTPQGERFCQRTAAELAALPGFALVAGRYEGVDERFVDRAVDREISIGDYVLSGGELAAAAVIDAVARFVPGVLGDAESAARDSFADGLLGHPHYTRPEEVDGLRVPGVLLSGNHGRIERWRRQQALVRTRRRRPDLLARRALSAAERALLDEIPDAAGEEADRERDD